MHPTTTSEPHLPHAQPLAAKPGKYLVITLGAGNVSSLGPKLLAALGAESRS